MSRRRKPSIRNAPPTTGKQPRVEGLPDPSGQHPVWSFSIVDVGGPWCFSCLPGKDLPGVLTRLGQLEGMTWTEIEQGTGSHFVPCSRLVAEARRRLQNLHHDDLDELFSLRIRGKPRIWGIRIGPVLRVLWWDPDHQVCESTRG